MPVFGNATDIRFNGISATKAYLNNNIAWQLTNYSAGLYKTTYAGYHNETTSFFATATPTTY
jgi:hypothetical protein